MAKLTRKEKKEIRTEVRAHLSTLIRNAEMAEEFFYKHQGREEALIYAAEFQVTLAESVSISGSDTSDS